MPTVSPVKDSKRCLVCSIKFVLWVTHRVLTPNLQASQMAHTVFPKPVGKHREPPPSLIILGSMESSIFCCSGLREPSNSASMVLPVRSSFLAGVPKCCMP